MNAFVSTLLMATVSSLSSLALSCSKSASAGGEQTQSSRAPQLETLAVPQASARSRYVADIRFISQPRPTGSAHWLSVQTRCADVFREAGFSVTLQNYGTGVNVIGERKGRELADELVILSAHYDSIPRCAGSDDNASGVAGVFEAARRISPRNMRRTLVLACWDEEERGLLGAKAFLSSLEPKVYSNITFEMIASASDEANTQRIPRGFGQLFPAQVGAIQRNRSRGDFVALGADAHSRKVADIFERYAADAALSVVRLDVPEAAKGRPSMDILRRSDHAAFWSTNRPSILLTDTAEYRNPSYHCSQMPDDPSTLNIEFALKVVRVTLALIEELLDQPTISAAIPANALVAPGTSRRGHEAR